MPFPKILFRRVAEIPGVGTFVFLCCAGLVTLGLVSNLSAESVSGGQSNAAGIQAAPALTEAQKNEIRAEELFRRQVAKELAADEDKGAGFWSVLNSSFALWFLSSVVIGGLAAAFTRYQKKHAASKKKKELRARLGTEISYRINNSLLAMDLWEKRTNQNQIFDQLTLYNDAIFYLDNRKYDQGKLLDFSIYQDYKTRRFLSLLYELRSSFKSAVRPMLRAAGEEYNAIEALADDAGIKNPTVDKANALGAIAQSIAHLKKLQQCEVWKNHA